MGGWVYGMIIIPLRGPSCKLRFARISDKLKFQDGPSVAKMILGEMKNRKKGFNEDELGPSWNFSLA